MFYEKKRKCLLPAFFPFPTMFFFFFPKSFKSSELCDKYHAPAKGLILDSLGVTDRH